MDLTQTIRHIMLVEGKSFDFFVELGYENLSAFCTHYMMVGHDIESCYKLNTKTKAKQPRKRALKKDQPKNFVPVRDGRPEKSHVEDRVRIPIL